MFESWFHLVVFLCHLSLFYYCKISTAVESRFFEPPRETKIASKNQGLIKLVFGQLTEEEKRLLVRGIGRFEKNEGSRKRDFLGTVVRFNISLSQCRFFL